MRDRRLTLNDGRQLQFFEYGPENGPLVLYFHATPGTGKELTGLSEETDAADVRLIAPNRPGYGGSSPHPDGGLLSWTDDVGQLLDGLGVQKCGLMGFSGGGQFAVNCACSDPGRFSSLILLSSMGPWSDCSDGLTDNTRTLWELARDDRAICESQLAQLAPDAETLAPILLAGLCELDQALLSEQRHAYSFQESLRLALTQGYEGMLFDMRAETATWPFDPRRLSLPTTCLHGADDATVSPRVADYLARTIPSCEIDIVPAGGHYFWVTRWRDLLRQASGGAA